MDCKAASNHNEHVAGFVGKYDRFALKLQNLRINTQDFEVVKTLATGAVGKVCLVIGKSDKQVYAMKVLKKTDLLTRREAAFFMEERNALVFARESTWITTLYAAFQDEENLYLVMEYASGGSLRSLMNNREAPMGEEEARFYVAELVLALEELHEIQYIHRDVKPENCLIGASGHLKLADFGSCIRMGDSNKISSHETVGTPVGIILYELLFDEVPFYSESLMETYGKIMDHEKTFSFPDDIEISKDAEDLIRKLICKKEARLGRNGIQEIKSHPWFKNFEWSQAQKNTPPFIPELSGPDDTRYFDDEENESKKVIRKNLPKTKEFAGQNLPFIGYSYVQNALASITFPFDNPLKSHAQTPTTTAGPAGLDATVIQKYEETIATLEAGRVKDAQFRDELQGLISRLERDRNRVEAEHRHLQTTSAATQRDREELESRLTAVRRRLETESAASKLRVQALTEERDAAVTEVSALRVELGHVREGEGERVERERVRDSERDEMQKALDGLNARLVESRAGREEAVMKMEDAMRRLDRETRRCREMEEDQRQLLQRNDDLEIDLKTVKKNLTQEVTKNDRLSTDNVELERLKTMLQVDLLSARRKIETLEKELETSLNDHQKTRGTETLTDQLAALTTLRDRNAEHISTLQKEKASLEIQLRNNMDLLKREREVLEDGEKRLIETREKLRQSNDRITFLEDSKQKMVAAQGVVEKEFEETKAGLVAQVQGLRDVEMKLETVERERNSMMTELEVTKSMLAKEVMGRKELTRKISDLERSLAEERRLRETLETDQTRLHHTLSDLKAELEHLQTRHAAMREDHDEAIQSKDNALTALKESHMTALLRLESETRERTRLNTSTSLTIRQLTERQQADATKISALENQLRALHSELTETHSHHSLTLSRSQTLQDRVEELETATQLLKDQLDDAKTRLSRSLDSLKGDCRSVQSDSGSGEKGRMRLRNVFFRSQQQKVEQERAMQRINEAEEDFRKDQERRRSRHISSDSNNSFRSNLTRLSDPVLNVDFDFSGGLRGFLKVPKFGKVKKGWRIRYAVVREYKLYMFDKDRDYEVSDAAVVADLRADLFLVRSVNQNELIHASAKDIDCIFKLQFTQTSGSSASSGNISTTDLTRKILKLKGDIQHEEKMQLAAERILNVTTESQKPSVLSQLEVSGKRIAKMKNELQGLMDLLQSRNAKSEDHAEANPNLEELSAEVFEEEVLFCKKELETQLDEEVRKYNNLLKLVGPSHGTRGQVKGAVPIQPNFKEIESEIQSTESMLHKLREDLAVLASEDKTRITLLVRRLCDRNTNGHSFKELRVFK
ncbi:Serine/threonine-protein kinase MRCK alpha [Dinochytrium kinnereticum]|nr:Serine/threonine-protein kinase MRCK alpha [Dinochytrium kinnereticum]